ncbi:MAG: replication protein RepA, partial [Steroidobacteraceae bacterium]
MELSPTSVDRLIEQALAIEAEDAKTAGALGYMARALVQASMPHSRPEGMTFERRNGAFSLVMMGHPHAGLPYGTVPRLLLVWLTTEAVRRGERELVLGDTLSRFMAQIELIPTGGRWGTITRLREQMRRLFAATISCTYEAPGAWALETVTVADRARLWWDPKRPDQAALWESTVTLSERFFREVTDRPIPIDLRAIQALRRSPLALDLYTWLTYRMSYLARPTEI